MTENEVTVMLAEAIDQDKEYKSWHVSTKHLMIFAAMVATKEREAIAQMVEPWLLPEYVEKIRARGYKQDGQCKRCTDGCPACDATKLPKEAHDLF